MKNPIPLITLEPQFLFWQGDLWTSEDDFTKASGVMFLCPKCFRANNGPVGTHRIICWSRSRGVPDHARPKPGRWMMVGSGYHNLTLNADPPNTQRSILLTGGCRWHGYVTNGVTHEA